jgi:hypothetical protein
MIQNLLQRRGSAAPPVYRPNAVNMLQRKAPAAPPVYRPNAANMLQRKAPAAPPVYRPHAANMLQRKTPAAPPVYRQNAANMLQRKAPAAPPVYRPHAANMLQRKTPAAPPVYRPHAANMLQRKTPAAPPVYRPNAANTLQQVNVGMRPTVIQQRPWKEKKDSDPPAYVDAQRNLCLIPSMEVVQNLTTHEPVEMDFEVLRQEMLQDTALDHMNSKTDLSGWNGRNSDLASAHHKFPKSASGWLFEHMSEVKQGEFRTKLNLPRSAGPAAIARLRSFLISPKHGTSIAVSGKRLDDPDNNQKSVAEPFLDLVETSDGSLTPRSRAAKNLASNVVVQIYVRYRLSGDPESFVLTDEEADAVIEHYLRAEQAHYTIEPDPTLPSHSGESIWETEGERYKKKPVPPILLPNSDQLVSHYTTAKQKELALADTRRSIIKNFFQWLAKPSSKDVDDIKTDLGWGYTVRFISGDKMGQSVYVNGRSVYDMNWRIKLRGIADGTVDPNDVEWYDALFTY